MKDKNDVQTVDWVFEIWFRENRGQLLMSRYKLDGDIPGQEDMSFQEIADRLGISQTAVMETYTTAMKKLRKRLVNDMSLSGEKMEKAKRDKVLVHSPMRSVHEL